MLYCIYTVNTVLYFKYVPPEAWQALETLTKGEWSVKSDVWAFGVTTWEIYSNGREPLYPGQGTLVDRLERDIRLEKPQSCDDAT